MTQRKNEGKYEVCQECGAHLDHGEQCDCEVEPTESKTIYYKEETQ